MPKVMIDIWGVPILERLLYNLEEAGIRRSVIVVGYKKDVIIEHFGTQWRRMEIEYREVDYHDDGILRSAIMGEGVISKRFLFVCGDTVLEPATIRRAMKMEGDLVVGVRNERIDESVTALVDEHGKVMKIGMLRDMNTWNRIVTGVAIANTSFFEGMKACMIRDIYDRPCAMQWMVEQGFNVRAFDMTEDVWLEIDNHTDLQSAKEAIFERSWKKRLSQRDVNIFKRLFNLPLSLRMTKLLSGTNLKPIHVNLISYTFALLAGLCFLSEQFVAGGIFSYACALADAMDGKLSRLKMLSSPLGGYYDSVGDRFAEVAIVSGLAAGIYRQSGNHVILFIGLLAILGWIGRFYMKELFIHLTSPAEWKGLKPVPLDLLGHRDVSFFITMVSCLSGYPLIALAWMAVFGNLFSGINFFQYRRYLKEVREEIPEDLRSR
jgi:choline kinase/phosphatidylglycerophosphate synthase